MEDRRRRASDYKSKYFDKFLASGRGFNELSAPDVVAWKLTRSAIEHENMLTNHRLTWFMMSQGFLLAFYGAMLTGVLEKTKGFSDEEIVPIVISLIGLLGMYCCMCTRDGLNRANHALQDLTDKYNTLRNSYEFDPVVPPLHHWEQLKFFNQNWIPVVMFGVWIGLVFCGLWQTVKATEAVEEIWKMWGYISVPVILAICLFVPGVTALLVLWHQKKLITPSPTFTQSKGK